MLDGIASMMRMESYKVDVLYMKGGRLKNLFNALKEKIGVKIQLL